MITGTPVVRIKLYDLGGLTAFSIEPGQIDSALNRKHAGTGLGLPLSQRLVRLLGGELEIESTRQRHGGHHRAADARRAGRC